MGKLDDAKKILKKFNMPVAQQSDICACTLLGLLNIKEISNWSDATNEFLRIHDIIQFCSKFYQKNYAENSRETFRKQAMHHFRTAAIIEDNNLATNSPNYRYRITESALKVIQSFDSDEWNKEINSFFETHESLIELYSHKRKLHKIPIKINNEEFEFSTGKHNELQRLIVEDFAPRFAPGSEVLYIGDTQKKDLYKNKDQLKILGIDIGEHEKLPDVILYLKEKDWVYFIEAVTSVGPINPKRITEISQLSALNKSGKIFVTAFLNLSTFKKFIIDIAWETEVWIAEHPEHMIHLNGDKFLGPR